ncbi:MAG: tRNA lysidine(34) synthetase TilS [Thermodesulfobacteriota bacterium]
MIEKVKQTIKRFGMAESGDHLLVAVSGGMDSVALLHLLMTLREPLGIQLTVCHLNHSLRGEESIRDEKFVRRLANNLGLAFECGREDLRSIAGKREGSLQEIARSIRYAFFEEVAQRVVATKVALGHTSDDNAETVLMRFIKGSSTTGLRGIPPVRGRYIRPLIETGRSEVEAFIKGRGLNYVEDSSNRTMDYLRNRVRGELIPFIQEKYNPNLRATLNREAAVIARDDDYLSSEVERVRGDVVIERGAGRVALDGARLAALHDAIMMRIFIVEVAQVTEKSIDITSRHLEAVVGLVRVGAPNGAIDLPGGVRLVREYDTIILTLQGRDAPIEFAEELRIPGVTRFEEVGLQCETTLLEEAPFSLTSDDGSTAYFDYDTLTLPLVIRAFIPGDCLVPFGMRGHKKVKDLFIDLKMPRPRRKRTPLLVSGGEILWVVGVRRSEAGKVVETTKRVLKVTCCSSGSDEPTLSI